MKKKLFQMFLLLALVVTVKAQKMGKFGADLAKKSIMGKEIRVPYTSMISYYGYIGEAGKPDEVKGGKNYYYLYVWIPAIAPEIGIRMISPVPESETPGEKDFKSTNYETNVADKTNFFDTWIAFDKASGITSSADIKSKAKSAAWNTIESNDDSGEMPANPSGSKYNSLMRMTSEVSDPLKALTVGLYRIGFTTYKTGDVKGGFLAQIGAPINIPGIVIASTLEELENKINGK
jgi:hypothetical protein